MAIKTCPQCYTALLSTVKTCPQCGYVFQEAQERSIKEADGNLLKIDAVKRKMKRQEVGKARTVAELENIAINRGYSMRWVSRMADIKHIARNGAMING